MRWLRIMDVKTLALASCLLMAGCAEEDAPTGTNNPGSTGIKVDLAAKTVLEGEWDGDDPGAKPYSWTYLIAGNSITVNKVQSGKTTEYYKGVFTLDSSVTPHRLDIKVIGSLESQFDGKTVQALYDYIGPEGSFDLLKISNTEPESTRPAELSDAVAIIFYKRGIGL